MLPTMTAVEGRPERVSFWPETVFKAVPNGQCAGVIRAIDGLHETVTKSPGQRVYGFHDIVHNTQVVGDFERKGVTFSDNLDEVPDGSTVMFSAHGVSPSVVREAQSRGMKIIDATCPLVDKVHREVEEYAKLGFTIILIGHKGHDEAIGTKGVAPEQTVLIETLEEAENLEVEDPEKVALTTQTTLSVEDTKAIREALIRKFPKLAEPKKSDICYATQNRQDAVKEMVRQGAQAVVVVGSPNSSNSNRLREVGDETLRRRGRPEISVMIDDVKELDELAYQFEGLNIVGVTSGASVPSEKLNEVIEWFKKHGTQNVRDINLPNVDESRMRFAPISTSL